MKAVIIKQALDHAYFHAHFSVAKDTVYSEHEVVQATGVLWSFVAHVSFVCIYIIFSRGKKEKPGYLEFYRTWNKESQFLDAMSGFEQKSTANVQESQTIRSCY